MATLRWIVVSSIAVLIIGALSCDVISGDPPGVVTPGPPPKAENQVTFAFWNLENLFDADDDPTNKGDDEFLSAGGWTAQRYASKQKRLASVIADLAPHVLGVAEVENRRVLEDLVAEPGLRDLGYQVVHRDSPDHRGIDVALLIREPVVLRDPTGDVLLHEYAATTRGILEIRLQVKEHPLVVYLNHWPSRRGGESAIAKRKVAAGALRRLILEHENTDDLLILGDLNDDPFSPSVNTTLAAVSNRHAVLEYRKGRYLYNPMWKFYAQQNLGTYYYNKNWSWHLFDQCIISKGLVEGGLRLDESSLRIHAPDSMRDKYGRPLRFGRKASKKWGDGFSDHFPIVGELVW